MTDQDAPTAQLPSDPPPPPPAGRPRLRRTDGDEKVLLGVAGGLGRHLQVDPVLVRVGFVLLALLGGLGIAVYAILAIAVPGEEGTDGAGPATLGIGAIAALLLVAVVFLGWSGDGAFFFAPGIAFVVLVVVAGALLVRNLRGGNATVGRVLLALLLLAVSAGLAVAAAAGVLFGGGSTVAIVAVGVGVALIVAGVLGGARWLILPALALAIPATVASASGVDLTGPLGNREIRPAAQTDLEPSYRVGAGRLLVDLREIRFRGTQDLRLEAGMGRIELLVPRGLCVSTRATASAGDLDVFGRNTSGVDVRADDGRTPRKGRPLLRLDGEVTMGQLTVSHEPAVNGFEPRDSALERQGACVAP